MTRRRTSTSPSRPSSRPRLRPAVALGLAGAAAAGAGAGWAQEFGPFIGYPTAADLVQPQILTLDQERLFGESAFGRRVGAEIEARSRRLSDENRSLEAELAAEEKALTEARPTLPPEEFRARADAFDARVQRIRAERDDRLRALAAFRDGEQQRFLNAVVPVLTGLLRAQGAVAVIDRRALVLALESIDVTDRAIAAVDAALGDGAAGAPQEGEPPGAGTPQPPPEQAGDGEPDAALGTGGDDAAGPAPDPGADPGTAILAPVTPAPAVPPELPEPGPDPATGGD